MGTDETEMEVDERLKLGQEDEHGDDSGPEKVQFLDAKPHGDEEEDSSGSSSSSGDGDDREEEDEQDEDDEEGEDSHGSPNREENGQFTEQNGDGKNLELPEKSNQIDYDEAPNHDNISEGDDRPLAINILEKTPVPARKTVARTSYEFSGLAGSNSAKKQKMIEDEETGTIEEQAEFMRELEIFHKERNLDFKPPKFYQEPLNLLKLWRAVIRLGGYERVTGQKLWRQVGESFHPPKTCTTVSWTFRIFYEKALLEYEKYKREIGEIEFPDMPLIEPTSVEVEGVGYQNSGSGRARRESATRAMQGWHVQRLIGFGEVGEPIIKEKNLSAAQKREKNLKSIGGSKQKRSAQDPAENHFHDRDPVSSVVDVGPPADWVKINVRESKDCFEVYALVPGLLREEVRVQSDPAGRLVITGQPEQLDNPWGITPFRKIISLPARINPLQTSAIVSLHGRLYVRVPFDRSNT